MLELIAYTICLLNEIKKLLYGWVFVVSRLNSASLAAGMIAFILASNVVAATTRAIEAKGVVSVVRGEQINVYDTDVHLIIAEDGKFFIKSVPMIYSS